MSLMYSAGGVKIKISMKIAVIILILLLIISLGLTTTAAAAQPADTSATKAEPLKQIFNDILATENNALYINYLADLKIISGYPDGSFKPKEGLTRAQAAVVLVKAAGLQTPADSQSGFADVAASHWAAPSIAAASKAGYLKGFPDGSYHPEEKLTRAQGIALIMRISTQESREELPDLTDMPKNHWAASDMGTALAAGMIGLSGDGKEVYPEAVMTRSSLARAMGTLLTKDPGLYQKELAGSIKDIKGEIKVTRAKTSTILQNDLPIYKGDTITAGANSTASIMYPDGSSVLIQENSQININESLGRAYIKRDGSSGLAVEDVSLEVKQGTLFGALASKQVNSQGKQQAQNQEKMLAAVSGLEYIAENKTLPWYQQAEAKKVKMKIDMPYGVAAIRGTFIMVSVNQDGSCSVSCLTGNAEVGGNAGSTVSLGGGQSSGVAQGGAATEVVSMTDNDKQSFGGVQAWVVNTALQMEQNKEAAAPPLAEVLVEVPDQLVSPAEQPVQVNNIIEVVLNALSASGIELVQEVKADLIQQLQNLQATISMQTQEILDNPVSTSGASSSPSQESSSDSDSGATSTASTACSVTTVIVPAGVSISGNDITASISNSVTSLSVELTVSPYASWKLYSDNDYVEEIADKKLLNLAVGENFSYIKVTAQDGSTEGRYNLIISRAASSDCAVTAVNTPAGAAISGNSITATVENSTSSLVVDLTVSPGASWKLYSDSGYACEIGNKQLELAVGANQSYFRVTAQDESSTVDYALSIYRPSNDANVSSIAGSYIVNDSNSTIQSSQTLINTNLTVESFLANLSKHSQASWKVVISGTAVGSQSEFDSAAAKTSAATLIFDDQLAVKAEDGTIKVYAIGVALGDPVLGASGIPSPPSGLKITYTSNRIIWGKYTYGGYDTINNDYSVVIVAFDQAGQVVQQWTRTGGRYVNGSSIDTTNQSITFNTDQGTSVTVSWSEIALTQP